jgi:hypothetical protein
MRRAPRGGARAAARAPRANRHGHWPMALLSLGSPDGYITG